MKRFEYHFAVLQSEDVAWLNERGQEGWQVINFERASAMRIRVLLMREQPTGEASIDPVFRALFHDIANS